MSHSLYVNHPLNQTLFMTENPEADVASYSQPAQGRAVGRSENPGGGGHKLPSLSDIALTDLLKSGGGGGNGPRPPGSDSPVSVASFTRSQS